MNSNQNENPSPLATGSPASRAEATPAGQHLSSACSPARLKGLAYRGSDGAVTCALCDSECEYEHCGICGGDGVEDAYEYDPINCSPGEEMTCRECYGRGGFYFCENRDCETFECVRILKAKPQPSAP